MSKGWRQLTALVNVSRVSPHLHLNEKASFGAFQQNATMAWKIIQKLIRVNVICFSKSEGREKVLIAC